MTTKLDPRPRSSGSPNEADSPADPIKAGPSDGSSRPDGSPRRLPNHISRLPILILYPHSRCNCRCLMCDIWRVTTRDEIDPAAVAAEIDRWRDLGVHRVVLSGGEPLMHRDLWSMVAPLVDAGIGITLLSTGLLLRRHAAAIMRHVDDLVVSLDGPPEIHDAIRQVPRAFARLAEGVAAVRAESQYSSTTPGISISARCTVQRANTQSLRATVRTARDLGLDRLSFLAVDSSSEAFNRPGGWPEDRRAAVAPGAADLPGLRAELDRLYAEHAADFATGFIAESPAKLEQRLYDYFAAMAGLGVLPPVTCNAPWVSAVVEADGTLRPCFFHAPIGRWSGGSIEDALNSPAALAFRAALDVGADPVCRRCVCSLNLA